MNVAWRAVATLLAWLSEQGMRIVRSRQDPPVTFTTRRLDEYRQLAGELSIVNNELHRRTSKEPPVQACLYVAVGRVARVMADSVSLFVYRSAADSLRCGWVCRRGKEGRYEVERRARLAGYLYQAVFDLVERARIAMSSPTPPRPVDPQEVVGDSLLSEPLADLEVVAQTLHEAFEPEVALAETERGAVPELVARLQSKSSVAMALATRYTDHRGSFAAEERLWGAQLYRQIFRLWILLSQELVAPGVIERLPGIADEPDPREPFLMTDPVAKARYAHEGRLEELERDIRHEVMRGHPWEPADLEYVQEVDRLQCAQVLRKSASVWNTSPHPPVFKVVRNGTMFVGGRRYRLRRGQEVVWACPMLRDLANVPGAVLVGNFNSNRIRRLCGEMSNAMLGRTIDRTPRTRRGGNR